MSYPLVDKKTSSTLLTNGRPKAKILDVQRTQW